MSFPYSTTLIFCKQIDVSQPANVCFFPFFTAGRFAASRFFFNIDTFCLNILLLTKENKISHPLHPIPIIIKSTPLKAQCNISTVVIYFGDIRYQGELETWDDFLPQGQQQKKRFLLSRVHLERMHWIKRRKKVLAFFNSHFCLLLVFQVSIIFWRT